MSEPEVPSIESRTINEVQASTRFLLDSLKTKMSGLGECAEDIRDLLRFGVDLPSAASTARRFFGTDTVGYLAIDGTDSVDQQLDLIVFYVGAFGYSGQVRFSPDSVVVSDPRASDSSMSISAAIPLSEEDAAQVFGQRRESGIEVDAERLPFAVMHLAEYYLAYKSVINSKDTRILLLDRTLAGDLGHLVWSTRDLIWNHLCVLEGVETAEGKVTAFDLELTRMLLPNELLSIPTPRSQLLKFASVMCLFQGDELTAEELIEVTGGEGGRTEKLKGDLMKLDEQFGIFDRSATGFKLRPGIGRFWERVLATALTVADHIFRPQGGHPLRISKGGKDVWVTADDLDFMVLIFIEALTRKAWTDKILPIGFIKDTNAFELVKAAVPLMENAGLTGRGHTFPNFNSDKMLLQTNSVVNGAGVPTPWHSIEMDAAFRTMAPVPDSTLDKGAAKVNGAYGNVIYPERVFVKTYIQLWSSTTAPAIRSHVFTFDRPVYSGYDHWDELQLRNKDGTVEELIKPVLHFKRGSEITNMTMAMLTEMGKEVVPEALGHNYPLFLADKKAKAVLEQTKQAYLGAVALEMAKTDLDQQVLFSRRFRDYRTFIEGTRKS
ncbi:MAG: hypothetical protein OK404_00885 [Thaumarchaeota archaeon]|nr:hypothetical protein [Nitrososphaerota archaeon]